MDDDMKKCEICGFEDDSREAIVKPVNICYGCAQDISVTGKTRFPTMEEFYNELDKKFSSNDHDERLVVDDSQLGAEWAFEWIKGKMDIK